MEASRKRTRDTKKQAQPKQPRRAKQPRNTTQASDTQGSWVRIGRGFGLHLRVSGEVTIHVEQNWAPLSKIKQYVKNKPHYYDYKHTPAAIAIPPTNIVVVGTAQNELLIKNFTEDNGCLSLNLALIGSPFDGIKRVAPPCYNLSITTAKFTTTFEVHVSTHESKKQAKNIELRDRLSSPVDTPARTHIIYIEQALQTVESGWPWAKENDVKEKEEWDCTSIFTNFEMRDQPGGDYGSYLVYDPYNYSNPSTDYEFPFKYDMETDSFALVIEPCLPL